MRSATSLLDKKTALRLLKHGVFLSNKTPPITNHQALLLLAEGVLDNFVKEFKSIVKELLSGCCLSDLPNMDTTRYRSCLSNNHHASHGRLQSFVFKTRLGVTSRSHLTLS